MDSRSTAATRRPVLLATDGSPSATDATAEAIALARDLGTKLVIVAIDRPVSPGTGFYGYGEALAKLRKAEHRRTKGALAHTWAAAVEAGVDPECVHGGAGAVVVEEICRLARARDARMIVVGAHDQSPIKRVLNGSVSTAVVHQAHCPVLVVPARPAAGEEQTTTSAELVRTGDRLAGV
jgi:nucleotide-binding universal stress UspA family protein